MEMNRYTWLLTGNDTTPLLVDSSTQYIENVNMDI